MTRLDPAASITAVRCPICTSDDTRVVARPDPSTYLRCGACGVLFVDPMPAGAAVEDAGAHYTDVYYAARAPRPDEDAWRRAATDVARKRMRRLEHALGKTGRFLDVGAGTGYLLAAARDLGWNVQGVEVSERAAEHARAALRVPIAVGTLEDARFDDEAFDAAVLSHVLEHVPDPVSLLRELHRIMAPGSILNVSVPHARALIHDAYNLYHRLRGRYGRDRYACGLYPPDHLYAFDRGSLRTALERGGFRVQTVTITGKGDPEHYPMVSWRGAGRAPALERPIEWAGRKLNRGSILDCIARRN